MANPLISSLLKYWKPVTGTVFTFATLFIVLFFGGLFYLYVSQNYSYLVERNFRLLATWSKELTETFQNYERSFHFRAKEHESMVLAPSSKEVRPRSTKRVSADEGLILEGFSDVSKVESVPDQPPHSYDPSEKLIQKTQEALSQLPFVQNVRIKRRIADGGSEPPEKTTVKFSLPSSQPTGQIDVVADGIFGSITATVSLDGLVRQVASEAIFDDVLLADPSGKIVYQRNPSTFQFLNLGNLLHHQVLDDGLLSGLLKEGGVVPGKPLDPQNLVQVMKTATPSHFQITVGGNSYEVFMQAMAFSALAVADKEQGRGTPWILCGILPSSTFREQYLAIPFTVLLLCLFVLISAFLSLPFISLLMMNPRERLTQFSVMSLLIANLLGAAVGTFFLLDLGSYRQMVADFHDRLKGTAESLSEAFHTQLDRMVWQLARYDDRFHKLEDLQMVQSGPESQGWLARVDLPDPCQDSQGGPLPFCYPNFSVVFWVDGHGFLRETWTKGSTPYVQGVHKLGQRDYVSKVQASPARLFRRLIDNRWFDFYAQPLISLESSTRSLVVSMPHRVPSGSHAHSPRWVAAIQSEDFSLLKDPVLPPGTGYAVIEDSTGLALFHSNGRRMLRENFLEETDNNAEIAALIHARAEGAVEGDYWGSGHRFAVKPLAGLPWTLVVFESKEAYRTINFEVLIFSLCLFTLYLIGFLLWMKILSSVYRYDSNGNRVRWTWPKPGLGPVYDQISVMQALTFFIGLLLLCGLNWQHDIKPSFFVFLAIVPLVVLWVVVWLLWKCHPDVYSQQDPEGARSSGSLQTSRGIGAFTRFALTSFLLLGVFPAIIFFKASYDQEMRVFSQHHLWGLARSLEEQTRGPWLAKGIGDSQETFRFLSTPSGCLIAGCQVEKDSDRISDIGTCSSKGGEDTALDLQYALQGLFTGLSLDSCPSFFTDNKDAGDTIKPTWFHHLHRLVRKSSLQNPMNKESWGFLQSIPPDASTDWSRGIEDGGQRVFLRVRDFPQGSEERSLFVPFQLTVWIPLFPWNLSVRFLGILFVALLLVAVGYAILRYMTGKIFVFPSCLPLGAETGPAPAESVPTGFPNLFVLGPPGSGKSQVAHNLAADCKVLDLHHTQGKEQWAGELVASVPEGTQAVLIDHFEYRWEDLAHRKEKTKLIEWLLSRGCRVAILSSKDPLEGPKMPWQDQAEKPQDADQMDWIDLLGAFVFVSFLPQRAEILVRHWLHPQLGNSEAKPRGLNLQQYLEYESKPTVQLNRIGNWIRLSQEWVAWSPVQLKEQFVQAGWFYYQTVWHSCSFSEKLALYHLAVDGYLHADNPALTALSQKGLIRLEPDLRVMNDSFRQCLLQFGDNLQLSKLEKQVQQDTWGRLKWPFLFILGTILLFFFFTQQEFKNSFIALISLLPILLPALPELPFLFSPQKTSSPSKP